MASLRWGYLEWSRIPHDGYQERCECHEGEAHHGDQVDREEDWALEDTPVVVYQDADEGWLRSENKGHSAWSASLRSWSG